MLGIGRDGDDPLWPSQKKSLLNAYPISLQLKESNESNLTHTHSLTHTPMLLSECTHLQVILHYDHSRLRERVEYLV